MENKALLFRNNNIKITLEDKEYNLTFDLDSFVYLESVYESVDKVLQMVLGKGIPSITEETLITVDGQPVDSEKVLVGTQTLKALLPTIAYQPPTCTMQDTVNILYAALMHDTAQFNTLGEITGYAITPSRIRHALSLTAIREANGLIVAALLRDLIPAQENEKNADTPEAK